MKTPFKILIALIATLFIVFITMQPRVTAQDSTIGTSQVYTYAGVPTNGTTEIVTLTFPAGTAAGTFTLTPAGSRTSPTIAWSTSSTAIVANVSAGLQALTAVGTNGCTVAAGTFVNAVGSGSVVITMAGKNAKRNFPDFTINAAGMTGTGTASTIATGTAGVEATYRNANPGQLLIDTVTPDLYINDSTSAVNGPTWTKVSP